MSATAEEARFVFEQWHRRIEARDGEALAALYRDDAVLESPLVPRVLDDTTKGIVQGRQELDQFLREITKRRPERKSSRRCTAPVPTCSTAKC
jgi:steroid delta-isomerase